MELLFGIIALCFIHIIFSAGIPCYLCNMLQMHQTMHRIAHMVQKEGADLQRQLQLNSHH